MDDGDYDINVVKELVSKDKKQRRRQIEFRRKDKEMISLEDVENLYKELIEEDLDIDPKKVIVVGENQERYYTLKALNATSILEFDDDYLSNKPADIQDVLTHFYKLEFITYQ